MHVQRVAMQDSPLVVVHEGRGRYSESWRFSLRPSDRLDTQATKIPRT